jgi:hypothetical protein
MSRAWEDAIPLRNGRPRERPTDGAAGFGISAATIAVSEANSTPVKESLSWTAYSPVTF